MMLRANASPRPDPPRREGQDGEAILAELGYGAEQIQSILKREEA